ncbi:type II toxin-antitoxin system Phd/YefM family antitoxin [Arthrobacter sp. cf158]|uniref:type II toxin-antitoxin system Phd/YefM family antitoxin n=1 Tax=Arthrobacter sp. cf158 TaxID=1761744 RepID=UPI000B092AA5|nr:type II toxin-antitoxin system Phd/YefM family antitoxin [Arthrobacter sp. cf158]
MTEMTVTVARSRLSEAVDTARVSHEPVYLLRRGRRVAALIDAEDLAKLIEAAEEVNDLRAATGSTPAHSGRHRNPRRITSSSRGKEALRKQRRLARPDW